MDRRDSVDVTIGHVEMFHSAGLAGPTRKVIPRQNPPDLIELEYGRRLVAMVGRLREVVRPLIAEIPRLIAAQPDPMRDLRADAPFAEDVLARAREAMKGAISPEESEQLARFFGQRLSVQQRSQLARQISTGLGVDVPTNERWISGIVDRFALENATLISSIPDNLHQEIANLTIRAFNKRMSPESFAALIEQRFGVAESKARFLAADQLQKLHGQVNAARQQSLGITHYFWRTRRDSRVRREHARIEGRRLAYKGKPESPIGMLPGEDYGCRCVAEPDLSHIIEQIRTRRAAGENPRSTHRVPVSAAKR